MSIPSQNINSAINAYNTAAKNLGVEKNVADDGLKTEAFSSLVKTAIKEAVKIGERSEKLSIQGVTDQADISKVVTAVSEAELTLQTAVTVRDKVIDAYNNIIRMPM